MTVDEGNWGQASSKIPVRKLTFRKATSNVTLAIDSVTVIFRGFCLNSSVNLSSMAPLFFREYSGSYLCFFH